MIPGDASSTPAPLPAAGIDNEVANPNSVDYLKVRVFLYKFAPELVSVEGNSPRVFGTVGTQASKASALQDQAKSVADTLRPILAILQSVYSNLNESFALTHTPDAVTLRQQLSILMGMNNINGNRVLILVDPNRGASAGSQPQTGTASLAFQGPGYPQYGSVTSLNATGTLVQSASDTSLYAAVNDVVLPYFDAIINGQETVASIATVRSILAALISFCSDALQKATTFATTGGTAVAAAVAAEKALITSDLQQFRVKRFVHDLNPSDLYRFDISNYVAAYNTSQTLGMAGVVGTISGDATFYDGIITLSQLEKIPSKDFAVRRPILFPDPPDAGGNYTSLPGTDGIVKDPITGEAISDQDSGTLIQRIAQAQTFEDNGGSTSTAGYSAFQMDVFRVEIAMRVRGIRDPRKKELILRYFQNGIVTKELQAYLPQGNVLPALTPGDVPGQLAAIKTLTNPTQDGITLSDLIQKRDFVSIFVYKQPLPPALVEAFISAKDAYFLDKESVFQYTPSEYLGAGPEKYYATYSPEFNGFVQTIQAGISVGAANSFRIDLMGSMGLFGATKRIYSSTIYNQSVFDAAEVMGSDLFNLYKNLYSNKDPLQILTTLLDSLYLLRTEIPQNPKEATLDQATKDSIRNQVIATAPANTPADVINKTVELKLANELNRLKTTTLGNSGANGQQKDRSGVLTSFLDVLSMRSFNQYGEVTGSAVKGPRHMFNMSTYLYANVMRMRRFNSKIPSSSQVQSMRTIHNPGGNDPSSVLDPFSSQVPVLKYPKQTDGSGGSILDISSVLNVKDPVKGKDWKAYFLFLSDSFANFNPELRTPLHIMNDVTASCYLELFETPGGRFVFRTPQYNNNIPIYIKTNVPTGTVSVQSDSPQIILDPSNADFGSVTTTTEAQWTAAQMLTSDDIISINTNYSQTVNQMVTKQQLGYGVDFIGQLIEQLYYFYSNGKLVSQYGLELGDVALNPNVRFISKEKLTSLATAAAGTVVTDVNHSTYMNGVFNYCRFFLEYKNIGLLTGSIKAVGNPAVAVGRTYFDIPNQKFGYISRVNKHLTVGQTYTVDFDMIAVRDAVFGESVPNELPRPTFRRLPQMEDFVSKFIKGSAAVKNVPPDQFSGSFASPNFEVLTSIGGEGETHIGATASGFPVSQ